MRFIDKTKELWNIEKGNAKRSLLKLILAVPFWLIVIALFLMAFGIGRAVYLIDTRPDQQIAEAWQSNSDTAFRHMAVFAGGIRAQGDTSPMTYQEGGKSIHLADIALIRTALQTTADTGSAAGSHQSVARRAAHRVHPALLRRDEIFRHEQDARYERGSTESELSSCCKKNYRIRETTRNMKKSCRNVENFLFRVKLFGIACVINM